MSCVGTNMLTAIQKFFGYKDIKKNNGNEDGHFVDLYWKFLNDMDGSRSEYEKQLEDLANYHRVMKTFMRSQSGESSELMEALNAEQSCIKVAAWLTDCEKVKEKESPEQQQQQRRQQQSRGQARKGLQQRSGEAKNSGEEAGLHYACVEVPLQQQHPHIYAEIDEVVDSGTMIVKDCDNHYIARKMSSPGAMEVPPRRRPSASSRRRSKSFNQRARSQSCKRSNSFIMLGPQLEEDRPQDLKTASNSQLEPIQKPPQSVKSSSSTNLTSKKTSSSQDMGKRSRTKSTSHLRQERGHEVRSEAKGRSRFNSTSSWEVTRRPREDDTVDSMWV